MQPAAAISQNLQFWFAYGSALCDELTDEQFHTVPPGHQNHMAWCLWHGINAADIILHRFLLDSPPVYRRDDWAARLPLPDGAPTPFGTLWTAEQVRAFHLDRTSFWAYTEAVHAALRTYLEGLSEEQALEMVEFPSLAELPVPYPSIATMNRLESFTFFAVTHLAEHLGEAQFIKGLLGKQGALA